MAEQEHSAKLIAFHERDKKGFISSFQPSNTTLSKALSKKLKVSKKIYTASFYGKLSEILSKNAESQSIDHVKSSFFTIFWRKIYCNICMRMSKKFHSKTPCTISNSRLFQIVDEPSEMLFLCLDWKKPIRYGTSVEPKRTEAERDSRLWDPAAEKLKPYYCRFAINYE